MTEQPDVPIDHSARALPRHSIVAGSDRVWIKRSNEDRHPKGTPFYETWWIEATTYAVQVDNREIQQLLNSGEASVLRRGDEVAS